MCWGKCGAVRAFQVGRAALDPTYGDGLVIWEFAMEDLIVLVLAWPFTCLLGVCCSYLGYRFGGTYLAIAAAVMGAGAGLAIDWRLRASIQGVLKHVPGVVWLGLVALFVLAYAVVVIAHYRRAW